MAAKVFISHKNEDAVVTGRVSRRLSANGLQVYVDLIDDALEKDGPDLGDYLRKRLGECTQLMAVVSQNTKTSRWVPWEIGIATEKNFLIATFVAENTSLPGYLEKWPYLRNDDDLDRYAEYSKRAERALQRETPFGVPSDRLRANVARNFHRDLRRVLTFQ